MDKTLFEVKMTGFGACICYMDIPLWRTSVGLEQVEIELHYDGESYSLICKDQFGDMFTYGEWSTMEEAQAWLDNPVALY